MEEKRLEILKIIKPIIEAGGYELVDLTLGSGKKPIIRIFIYRPEGITIDDCVVVSKAVQFELDSLGHLGRYYKLEVSSPGLDRPLMTERDFARNVGEEVRLFYKNENGDNEEFEGKIISSDKRGVKLEFEGEEKFFLWDSILRGKLIY